MAKYMQAGKLYNKKIYDKAYALYEEIKGYKDVDTILADQKFVKAAAVEAKFQVGNTVKFGSYPQSENGSDKTPVEWIVLDRDGRKALLLSKKGLDAQKYDENKKSEKINWANCFLRKWLNKTFINTAFTSNEQKGILLTNVDNSASQGDYNNGCENTDDKVFLLSYYEATKYLDVSHSNLNKANAQLEITSYARKISKGDKWWWLRSRAGKWINNVQSSMIRTDGRPNSMDVDKIGCIRPALWVDLDSGVF